MGLRRCTVTSDALVDAFVSALAPWRDTRLLAPDTYRPAVLKMLRRVLLPLLRKGLVFPKEGC